MDLKLDGITLDLSFLPEDVQEKASEAITSAWNAGTKGLRDNRDNALREKKEAQEQARNAAEGNNAEVAIKLSQTQERVSELEGELRIANHNAEQAQSKLTDQTKAAEEWQGKHDTLVKHTGLTQALSEVKVTNPALLDGARALLMSQISQGEEGALMMGDKALAEALTEWAETDAGKAYVSNGASTGGGAESGKGGGADGPNPFKPESRDINRQIEIAKTNPELAKQLEAEAGIPSIPVPAVNQARGAA